MTLRFALLAIVGVVASWQAALAQGACPKKTAMYDPIPADSRLCQLDQVFSSYLTNAGFKESDVVSTYERVLSIGSTLTDSREFPPVLSPVPSAKILISHHVSEEEDIFRMNALLYQRPGYFAPLETVLAREGLKIVCETQTAEENAFLAAGGELNYEIRLVPKFFRTDQRGKLASANFSISSCEVH